MMKRLLPLLLVCAMLLATPASIAFAAEEPEVVTWIVPGDRPEDLEIVLDDLNAKLREKINVELDLKFYGWGEYEEKARLMTTSGGQDEIVSLQPPGPVLVPESRTLLIGNGQDAHGYTSVGRSSLCKPSSRTRARDMGSRSS